MESPVIARGRKGSLIPSDLSGLMVEMVEPASQYKFSKKYEQLKAQFNRKQFSSDVFEYYIQLLDEQVTLESLIDDISDKYQLQSVKDNLLYIRNELKGLKLKK